MTSFPSPPLRWQFLPLWLACLILPTSSFLRADETPPAAKPAGITSENNERLREGLKQFPEADTNHDGILTLEEGRAFLAKMKGTAGGSAKAGKKSNAPSPTAENAHYGPYDRNVLDFWQAKSDKPTPLIIFIHGGGFVSGDKSGARGGDIIADCLSKGVSFASINYRYRTTAPIQDVLRDCARAVQFLRSKAGEWNLDKTRVAAYGGSAGAGTSLWLAFHDDMADPQNSDPVLHESTKLVCAGALSTQFSYDVLTWPKVFGEDVCRRFSDTSDNWPAFYGLKTEEELKGSAGEKIRADCDMLGLIKKGATPVFLDSNMRGGDITDRNQYLHSPKHAEVIKQRCDKLGVECIASIPALKIAPKDGQPKTLREFMYQHLGVDASAKTPEVSANANAAQAESK